MIQKIGLGITPALKNTQTSEAVKAQNLSNPVKREYSQNFSPLSLVNAYQAYNGIKTAKTVSFGQGLADVFNELKTTMITCKSEEVGQQIRASHVINKFYEDLPNLGDAIKTNIEISRDEKAGTYVDARTQLKNTPDGIQFEMAVREPRPIGSVPESKPPLTQKLSITHDHHQRENAYILNTKGKLMAVVEDGDNVLLTKAGAFSKKIETPGLRMKVKTEEAGNVYEPFVAKPQEVKERVPMPSIGEGTEIVIGMENGRFVYEIIDSIETFVKKVQDGEIVLDQFVANPNAKNTQLTMMAGGFGSRAEYTNASSSGIFHGKEDGAQSTKGVFRTATGLTPMETTFITLHNAGLLDCSKENLGIGKNIKLYLNRSGKNYGNGGFTIDIYNKMEREGRNSLTIFPNDSMSRLTEATKKMTEKMNTGEAAIVMIAKEVEAKDAKNFGIMNIDNESNRILGFKEKPNEAEAKKYVVNGKCLANTFQFSVSKEAFKALSILEEYLPPVEWGHESRDWSKVFTPVIMAIAHNDKPEDMQQEIDAKMKDTFKGKPVGKIPLEALQEAKNVLGNQKVYAIPTDEPWADCGNLNALYHTIMQIASTKDGTNESNFPLEDFERKHVLDSINTQTGLIASTPEQKAEIERKYNIDGEVMVVPQAKYVPASILGKYINQGCVAINE